MAANLTPAQFIAKWLRNTQSERATSQEHFIDLCRLLGQPTPAEHDSTGAEYAFEKGVVPTGAASRGTQGERGFADVWWRGKFAWEYKRKGKYRDLTEAYRQLCQYREALENPPLLIVSDIARIEIHTNFTGTAKQVHVIELETLDEPGSLDLLRRAFTDPNSYKPTVTPERITEAIAKEFSTLAQSLRDRGHDPQTAAHFLMKCMFCLFAEDVDLLPRDLFTRILQQWKDDPKRLLTIMGSLFDAMREGGAFGAEPIERFNGGLFQEAPPMELTTDEIGVMLKAAKQDWSSVEPAIFGTLFERSLDPSTRAQIGAHYTSRDDIMLVVEPVILAPLKREWDAVQAEVNKQLDRRRSVKTQDTKKKADAAIEKMLTAFAHKLASLRILDPACGSGNFLYVAIQQLLGLEKEVITFAAGPELGFNLIPHVRPTQLSGIEINPYAAELAQVVVWIGYLQWMRDNGFIAPRDPVLEPITSIECRDAILANPPGMNAGALNASEHPHASADESPSQRPAPPEPPHSCGADAKEHSRRYAGSKSEQSESPPVPATWPEADFIIGNPPFLGGNYIRRELGDEYVDSLFSAYDIPNFSDLCCYWFELSRRSIEHSQTTRVGLLATQGIRGGANREVLQRIKDAGGIFLAWSDREWILEGAHVHVSIVGFDCGTERNCLLDGSPVSEINSDLTSGTDLTQARILDTNSSIQHEADKKGAPFDLDWTAARDILATPCVSTLSPLLVCRPWVNGQDCTRRSRAKWIVDFGTDMDLKTASSFDAAFAFVKEHVAPRYEAKRKRWWLHERPRPHMRVALQPLNRFIATPILTKHRLFVWMNHDTLPDHQVVVFARADDYFFGVLHSSIHELWARRMGTQLREAESGFRYTPTTCFETFPLPWPPGTEPDDNPLHRAIADAARELDEQRQRWLNPPEWIEPIAAAVDAEDDFADVPADARPLIRRSAIMARAAKDARLKKRTLTNLYNERPTWLRLAHERLDRAVLAAYAATDPGPGPNEDAPAWSEDWAEVWTETGAGTPLPEGHELSARRTEVDQAVLANLLRLNLARAQG